MKKAKLMVATDGASMVKIAEQMLNVYLRNPEAQAARELTLANQEATLQEKWNTAFVQGDIFVLSEIAQGHLGTMGKDN